MKAFFYIQTIVLLLCAILLAAPTLAQDMPPLPGELVIGDLPAPRGIAFDAEGNLFVAVAGTGGEQEIVALGPRGEQTFRIGLSGQVISVSPEGKVTPVMRGIPSALGASETLGVYRAIPHEDVLWVLNSISGPFSPFGNTIVEMDLLTGFPRRIINPSQFEALNNPDGNEIESNVTDIAWLADGTMVITDAGANALLRWTEAEGLSVITAWPDNPVPTSIEIAENGDFYIGFLGAGVAPGAGKIEHWSNGKLVETFSGLTAVTDILLDGETLYAVQLFLFTEQGPGPGSVVMVNASGVTPVAEGLVTPFALAKGPDGALYVSFGTIAFAPGMTGGVVRLAR